MKSKKNIYPDWICKQCAESRGYRNINKYPNYHENVCGWCEQKDLVTLPRDYGYPVFHGKNVE